MSNTYETWRNMNRHVHESAQRFADTYPVLLRSAARQEYMTCVRLALLDYVTPGELESALSQADDMASTVLGLKKRG